MKLAPIARQDTRVLIAQQSVFRKVVCPSAHCWSWVGAGRSLPSLIFRLFWRTLSLPGACDSPRKLAQPQIHLSCMREALGSALHFAAFLTGPEPLNIRANALCDHPHAHSETGRSCPKKHRTPRQSRTKTLPLDSQPRIPSCRSSSDSQGIAALCGGRRLCRQRTSVP